jgi:AraC-like DNA-binding protein
VTTLKQAVHAYAGRHANRDGLALTPVPGLRMMRVDRPGDAMHSIYKPLVCLVLQGAKRMSVGAEERVFSAGESVIVGADMPVVGRIVEASPAAPYLAVAIELDMTVLREVSLQVGGGEAPGISQTATMFAADTEAEIADCASRLVRLLRRPAALPVLRPAILSELHYWLLSGPHGAALRVIAAPDSHAARLGAAIAILRQQYRSRVPVEQLAAASAMSPTAFHKHFKRMMSLTPGQYQKRLRLIEARRLMLDAGMSATRAASEVGYESVSQFTREYARMYQTTPKRDALRARGDTNDLRSSAA